MTDSRTVFSVSAEYFAAAEQELRSVCKGAGVERLGPDAGCLRAAEVTIADVARACRRDSVVFVRHLMRELARIPLAEVAGDMDLVGAVAAELLASSSVGTSPALQVWISGDPGFDCRANELWHRVADRLSRQGYEVVRAGREQILSICVTPKGVVLGLNHRSETLADWPGGRVGLARSPQQISRAEFKLEELFQIFELPLPAGGVALDLGASPGGWSRILRQRGFTVWAVDPADLDPRIAGDPRVYHARTTAGPFLAESGRRFDLVVNDMRMTPVLSCQVMLDASRRLKPGGFAIMTFKISPHEPLRTVRTALGVLARSYDVLHARQLYHNRNEITVVARYRGTGRQPRPRRQAARSVI